MDDPKKAAIEFWKKETASGLKTYWDKGHILNHENGGIGIIFASGPDAKGYDSHTSRFMQIRSLEDIDDVFTHYEDFE